MIIEKVFGRKPFIEPQFDDDLPDDLSMLEYEIKYIKTQKLKIQNFFVLSLAMFILIIFFYEYLIKKV